MVSFQCEACGDVLTKKSLDKHRNQCRGASFSCIDCMVHFHGTDYRSHTSCISEAQKVQGSLYREKSKKGDKGRSMPGSWNSDPMVPQRAYVEDAPDGGDDSQAVAIVDVPPRAPTPPTAAQDLPENVNVFDFLVTEETPNGARNKISAPEPRREIKQSVHYPNGDSQYSHYATDGSQFSQTGFSYGDGPLEPSFARYDSWQNLTDSQQSHNLMPPPAYVTPAPKESRRHTKDRPTIEKSDKKRKRGHVEELDLSSTTKRPSSRDQMMIDAPTEGRNGRVLHSGLTGGLNKLITDPEFLEDRIDAGPTPILSPVKRSKRGEADADKKSRRTSSYVSYGTTTSKGSSKHAEDKQDRSRDSKYHDDKQRRRASPDRSYHDDRHRSRRQRESLSSDDRPRAKHMKAIEYPDRPSSVQPNATNQLVSYTSRPDLFLSFINKGPDSDRGCSINKVLKRYHRERGVRSTDEKEDEDKELWKSLRLRRNDRGEIVLFF
ncbi:uncharacterized protein LTR77_010176 [Saxophila tyrrhenica]|uniref:Zinc finger C2H2 LYAR-type domain-containing protein n=1 Tax=Saxophila tyrrhenica TaxID=1690608 RepID=A0AAV9NYQ3_9PEZI|nr:hypothetical protein LTR77_010176 [Saxophila tyrrhenica]